MPSKIHPHTKDQQALVFTRLFNCGAGFVLKRDWAHGQRLAEPDLALIPCRALLPVMSVRGHQTWQYLGVQTRTPAAVA